jgi:hypothetical protein
MVLMTKTTADLFHSPGGTKETKEVSEEELPSDIQAIQQLHSFAMVKATGLEESSNCGNALVPCCEQKQQSCELSAH